MVYNYASLFQLLNCRTDVAVPPILGLHLDYWIVILVLHLFVDWMLVAATIACTPSTLVRLKGYMFAGEVDKTLFLRCQLAPFGVWMDLAHVQSITFDEVSDPSYDTLI